MCLIKRCSNCDLLLSNIKCQDTNNCYITMEYQICKKCANKLLKGGG